MGFGKKKFATNNSNIGSSHGSTKPLNGSNKPHLSRQSSSTRSTSRQSSSKFSSSSSFIEDIPGFYNPRNQNDPNKPRRERIPAEEHNQRFKNLPQRWNGVGMGTTVGLAAANGAAMGAMGHSSGTYTTYSGGKMHTGTYTRKTGPGCLEMLVGACLTGLAGAVLD